MEEIDPKTVIGMKECDYQDAMTVAEKACQEHLAKFLDMKVWRDANPGNPDCGVFNIGYLYTGEHTLFRANALHFRAQLDLFCRDRTKLQQFIMRILESFPINADTNATDALRERSNVHVFRVAPETRAVGEVTRTDIQMEKDGQPIITFTCAITFDVVFQVRF